MAVEIVEIDVLDRAETSRFAVSVLVSVLALVVAETFEQFPNRLGRQLEQDFPAFTQAHPLHWPVLLHLQHTTIFQINHQHINAVKFTVRIPQSSEETTILRTSALSRTQLPKKT